jgi:Protein of Unknown function (DUF2784)
MPYRLAADAVLVLHAAFVLFVVLGGLFALRRPRFAWVHLPAAAWGAAIEFFGWVCPLTPLEQALRRRGGEAGYSGGFVEHYVVALLYPQGLTRGLQLALGLFVLAVNLAVYAWVWRRARRRRRAPAAAPARGRWR